MVATRVANLTQQRLITAATLRTQRNVNDLQVQIATGKRTQSFSGISKDASRLVTIKSELTKAEQFLENITVTEKRLDLMQFVVDQIEEITRDFRGDISTMLNGSAAERFQLQQQAAAVRDQIVQLLNTRDDSRFLFAGGKVTTSPVDLGNGTYTAPTAGTFDAGPDTGYYEGDSVTQSTRIDDGFTISYGVLANESAFEKIIRTLDNVAQNTFTDPISAANQTILRSSITELSAALDNNGSSKTVADLASDIGLDRVVMENAREKHFDFIRFAQDTIGSIENIDAAETITALNFEQIQLESSFTTIARIQTLSLSNFLR
jgi:flagellar hook-associated protein 3 FlgL